MKKFFTIAAIAAIAATMNVNAECVMSFGNGGEYRINPAKLGSILDIQVGMSLDYRADNWVVDFTYPQGFTPHDLYNTRCMDAGADMVVAYTDYNGNGHTYTPYLNIGEGGCSASAYIPVNGYYDYNEDGIYEPYGSAKWEAGQYPDMFTIHFWVDDTFRKGDVIMDGHFASGYDRRGGTVGERLDFYKRIHVWVGYMVGDVDGNERINIADVTTLINYLLTKQGLDEFMLAAADVNSDGNITINDVTALINYLLTNNQ